LYKIYLFKSIFLAYKTISVTYNFVTKQKSGGATLKT
jgi:hypothetical protein